MNAVIGAQRNLGVWRVVNAQGPQKSGRRYLKFEIKNDIIFIEGKEYAQYVILEK